MNKKILQLALLAIIVVAATWLIPRQESDNLLGAASGKAVAQPRQIKVTALKNVDPKSPRLLQLGVEPIIALVNELEARGSKVEMAEFENSGLSLLQIKIDGREIAPVISECKSCEPIVFEY